MSSWSPCSSEPRVASIESPLRGWTSRTTVVLLATGGVAVYNPCANLAATARDELAAWGEVTHLVAPNHFHHLGLPRWRDWFPRAAIVASATARPRLQKQGVVAADAEAELAPRLPRGVRLLQPAGTRTGELWLSVASPSGTGWIVGDAFFNVPSRPPGMTGWLLAWTGTVPGLRIGSTFVRMALRDRAAYRLWLTEALAREQPAWLVPAHGDVCVEAGLVNRLAELADLRL